MTHAPRLQAYGLIARLTAVATWRYPGALGVSLGAVLLQVFLLQAVWSAAYAGRGPVQGVERGEMLAYVTLANLQLWLFAPILAARIQQRVGSGAVAVDLARPGGYIRLVLAEQAGISAALLPYAAVGLLLALLAGSLRPPASPGAAAVYGLSLALGYAISVLLSLLLGLLAFPLVQVGGFLALQRFLTALLGGALVPLWLLPGPLRLLAEALPFQGQAYLPVSLYLGRLEGAAALQALLTQALWVLLLAGAARLFWPRAARSLAVQGG